MKLLNFENWSIGLLLPNIVTDKKCAPKYVLFNEKKNQKDLDDLWHTKFPLKVQFWHFGTS